MVILDEETVRDVVRMRGGYHHETAIGKKDKISYDEFLIGLYTSQGFEKKDLRIFWKKITTENKGKTFTYKNNNRN